MKHCLFLTDFDLRHGFALAGALQDIPERQSLEDVVAGALADPGNALVALDGRLLDAIPEERFQEWEGHAATVLAVLPPPAMPGTSYQDTHALRLIQKAIGYKVRM